MRAAGLHESYRTQAEATALYSKGDPQAARQVLARTASAVAGYAPGDAMLQEAVGELDALQGPAAPSPQVAKETVYQAKRRLRGQRDHRGS
jgi:hypothetical protein